jgi:hypothetical protein
VVVGYTGLPLQVLAGVIVLQKKVFGKVGRRFFDVNEAWAEAGDERGECGEAPCRDFLFLPFC